MCLVFTIQNSKYFVNVKALYTIESEAGECTKYTVLRPEFMDWSLHICEFGANKVASAHHHDGSILCGVIHSVSSSPLKMTINPNYVNF